MEKEYGPMRLLLVSAAALSMVGPVKAQSDDPTISNRERSPAIEGKNSDGTRKEYGQKIIESLTNLPKPEKQSDLNTENLASAHRERAMSVQQKTDGLWQSWLVSICEGCGPERQPFTDKTGEDFIRKIRPQLSQPAANKPTYVYYYPATGSELNLNTANDLSNESIDRIRRDPNR
jgi:hypothetical protein